MSNWPIYATAIYAIVSLAIKLVMIVVVPQRRTVDSALLWLVFIFIIPILGLIFYLIFGRTKLSPYRLKIQRDNDVRLRETIRRLRLDGKLSTPSTSETSIEARYTARLNETLGGFPVVGGNSVELLPEYQKSIDRIIEDIGKAQKYIHVEYYIFVDDETGTPFINALIEARKRGVTCRVLVDYLSSLKVLKRLRKRFEAEGIDFEPMLSPFAKHHSRIDLRNHRKIVVIDGLIAYTGSQNIVNRTYNKKSNIKNDMQYDELVARIEGPIALELNSIFLADWEAETGTRLESIHTAEDVIPAKHGDVLAQIAPSGPAYSSDNNRLLFVSLIHTAKKKIVITTPYFVPDSTLGDALKIAQARGVQVALIVPYLPDAFITSRAQRSYYQEFLEAGISIYLYDPPNFLHAKHMSFDDDIAVIGSSNMDIRSLELNAEVSLIAYDRKVVSDMHVIEAGYLSRSHQLHMHAWQRRPKSKKVVENVVRLLSKFV